MSNTDTNVEPTDRSYISIIKPILNYGVAFHVQYGFSFGEARIKDLMDDMIPPRFLPSQARSSYVPYVRFGRLLARNEEVLPLLESFCDGQEAGRELGVSHLDSEVLYHSHSSFYLLFIDAEDFYIKNLTKSVAFHAPSFYRCSEQVLHVINNLPNEVNILLNRNFSVLMHRKLTKASDEAHSIKQLFSNYIRLFKDNPSDKKRR